MSDIITKWVLDITEDEPVFVLCDEDGIPIPQLTVKAAKCPGELIGVFHANGEDAIREWCRRNKNWRKKYQR